LVTITFTVDSIEALRKEVRDFFGPEEMKLNPTVATSPVITRIQDSPVVIHVDPKVKPFELDLTTKKTRKKRSDSKLANGTEVKTHEVSEAEYETPVQETAPAQSSKVTRENVHQALQQVNVAAGLPRAREILAEFKAPRLSDIPEDQFEKFVNRCNEVVMSS
jgi:hypothetical protein